MEVNFAKVYDGYAAFRKLSRLARNKNSRRLYFEFLGIDEQYHNFNSKNLTEEAVAKIEWITGPHAYTMFRAWEARNNASQ